MAFKIWEMCENSNVLQRQKMMACCTFRFIKPPSLELKAKQEVDISRVGVVGNCQANLGQQETVRTLF